MPGVLAATAVALTYQQATRTISGRLSAVLAMLWQQTQPWSVTSSWDQRLPEAVGAFTAAQSAAAGMADGYVTAALHAQGAVRDVTSQAVAGRVGRAVTEALGAASGDVRASVDAAVRGVQATGGDGADILGAVEVTLTDAGLDAAAVESALRQVAVSALQGAGLAVNPAAFTGQTASGLSLETLLSIPAQRARQAVMAGVSATDAMHAGEGALRMYAATEIPDVTRTAAAAAAAVKGTYEYIRVVGPFCCSRCAILAGRLYHTSGFERHPSCHCEMLPVAEADSADVPSPMDLYRQGRITDLTVAEKQALDMGANISQVVNAKKGMYTVGGRSYTTSGTTLRGVAGSRLTAATIDRAAGTPQALYGNMTISRQAVAQATAKYGPMMRRGTPFQRLTPTGVTTTAYRRSGVRRSVSQILKDASTHEVAVTDLVNEGYILSPRDAAGSTSALNRLFAAS